MIKPDSQLHIQIGDLASAQVGLYSGSENLLNGNLTLVEWRNLSASGTFSLPSSATLRLDLVLEHLIPHAASVKATLTNTGNRPSIHVDFAGALLLKVNEV